MSRSRSRSARRDSSFLRSRPSGSFCTTAWSVASSSVTCWRRETSAAPTGKASTRAPARAAQRSRVEFTEVLRRSRQAAWQTARSSDRAGVHCASSPNLQGSFESPQRGSRHHARQSLFRWFLSAGPFKKGRRGYTPDPPGFRQIRATSRWLPEARPSPRSPAVHGDPGGLTRWCGDLQKPARISSGRRPEKLRNRS